MRRALAFISAAAALIGARDAGAFCQSAACPPGPSGSTAGQVCTPSMEGDCGIPLQWRQPCISFAIQQDASTQVDYATADATLTEAMATWTGSDCDGGGTRGPSIQVFDFGSVACDQVEYNELAGNANILIFRDDMWPHDTGGGGVDTLALTTVTYDVDTADIYDADIEVNTADNTFSTTASPGPDDVDLLSVLTHETGHYFGLAHTMVYPATMFASYTPGTDSIRDLTTDDVNAICAAYPVDRTPTGTCTGIPRHGFASLCAAQQTDVSCSASAPGRLPARGERGGGWALAALALAGAARLRARRASPRS
jgi:hypothetical protein